ncbi:MAG: hypothetical protein AB7D06_01520 [Pedobacter sp.]
MKNYILAFFCFAIPAYLLSGLFGLAPYLKMLGPAQLAIKLMLLGGFVFVLVSFWKLESLTTDDKLFWTIGTLFVVPIGLPLLYFKLSKEMQQTDFNQAVHSDG